jgi:hypothetical protein
VTIGQKVGTFDIVTIYLAFEKILSSLHKADVGELWCECTTAVKYICGKGLTELKDKYNATVT